MTSRRTWSARAALNTYRNKAKLVITTMLHCALPVIAMGIPVIAFYPLNEGAKHNSDLERFSSLAEIVRVFRLSEAALIDWRGYTPDVGALKLKLVDTFFSMAARWGALTSAPIEGIAPASELPVPQKSGVQAYFDDLERFARLVQTKSSDRQKWGAASSYKPQWAERGQIAAKFIHDGSRVLEIGTGVGAFRGLIAHRCHYTGADLEPLDDKTRALDLDHDPLPDGTWDTIVLLGVLEYLYFPVEALKKIANAAPNLVLSYCCSVDQGPDSISERRKRGWTNAMTEQDIKDEMRVLGFQVSRQELFNSSPYFMQVVFEFVAVSHSDVSSL